MYISLHPAPLTSYQKEKQLKNEATSTGVKIKTGLEITAIEAGVAILIVALSITIGN